MDGTILEKKLKLEEKLAQLNEIAQKVDDMPVFTSNDRAFLEELPGFPTEDGKKVLTATTESGETSLGYEKVESGTGVDIETTETVVGIYKGKTLYRRVFRLNPENGNANLDTNAIYDTAWLEFGWCEYVNGSEMWRIPLPYYGVDGTSTVYFVTVPIVQDHKLKMACYRNSNGQVANRNIEVSILYTKYEVSKKTKKKSEE